MAGSDDKQCAAVGARQIVGCQRRGSRSAPVGQGFAVDHGARLAGLAIEQEIERRHRSETALGVLRKHRDELDAERLAANPGRHRQETGGRAVDADLVGLPQRHRLAVAPEGLTQCFDQLGKGKRGMDVGSGVTAQHRYHPVPIMKVR